MHVLCDFATFCLNFHTLLSIFGLTYLLSAPSCQFLFSAVFVFQVFPIIKVPNKSRKNYIKNQRSGSFWNNQDMAGGPPPGAQEGARRGSTLGRATRPPGCPVAPLVPPFSPIFTPAEETLISDPFSPEEIPISTAMAIKFRGDRIPGFISIAIASSLHEAGV